MKFRPTSRLAFPLASAIAALLAAPSAHAVNLWWDTNGATITPTAATGTWTAGSTANWTTVLAGNLATAAVTTTNNDDLTFNATGMTTATITVSGTQLAHSITFNTATTLSGGTAINLGSAVAGSGLFFGNQGNTINTPIILNSAATAIAITNTANQTQTFGGTITGDAASGTQTITLGGLLSAGGQMNFNGIISNGLGGGTVAVTVNVPFTTTTLAAANTYTGATNILAGTLQVNNATTFANTSVINLGSTGRLNVNAANSTLAKLATGGGGSGVVADSFLRYSQAQTTAGVGNGPGTIFGTVELNVTNVNPNYTLDFGSGGALTNLVTSTYTSALTLSGTASIDSSTAVATYSGGTISASTAGAKTLNLTGTNTGANTISGNIGDGSGTIGITKGGGGTWVLSGTNTNTGSTRVDAGTLQFVNTASLYNSTTGSWTAANIRVGNGGTLALNVGGTNQFTTGNVTTLLGNLGGANGTSTTGFAAGSAIGFDTTNASGSTFTVADVLANSSGTGGGDIGLTKLGSNTLVLSSDNTYTGRTVISGGTLQLGAGGTTGKLSTSSSILNNGTLTINRSGTVVQGTDFSAAPIVGTGAFIQAGTSTTTLNAANTFSGTTTVSAGTLALTNAFALQNSALNTTGAGFVTLSSATPTFGGLSNSGTTRDLATVISSGYTGVVTNLTLNTVGAGSFTYGGIIGEGATGMTLTKTGTGTQVLSGANAYTGDTIVNGGTLTVGSGATGSINSSSGLQMGGGTFNYSRTGTGQTLDGLTVNTGNSTVNNTSSGQTLTLGAITRTGSIYGTVNFATLTGAINTSTTNTNGIIGPWATTGSTTTLRYAVGGGNISALTGTAATAGTLANVTSATDNYEYSAAATTAADLTANTLRYSGGNTTTAIGATNTLTLNGLMNAGSASTLLISGGPTTGGIIIGSTNELVITANAFNTTISSVIKDGGSAGRLIYGGAGSTLTLSGLNTYSGGLVINSGIVKTGALSSVSSGGTGTGAITVQGAGTLELNSGVGTLNRALTLNGGRLYLNGSGGDLTVAGTIVLGANSTIDATNTNSGFPAISANISGTGGFTKTNLGGLRLNGTNTYTGPTVISAGGVTVKSSLYGNDTTKWTPANITVANISTLTLNVGGVGEFSTTQAHTMFSQLSSNVNNNGLQAGSFIGVDTRNAPNGTYIYSGNITDSTGAGGGSVSFKHTGTANHILELTGTNTYTGMSIVDNEAFLKVSSINSVFTNAALGTVHSASSSLGAPTTVANGTIHLGTAGSTAQSAIGNTFRAGGLIYTGTGETTDRIISMNDGANATSTLDQSGTGHLKFLSALSSIDTRGPKTLVLRGSTTGTAELAGTIPNPGSGGSNLLTKSGTGTWILSGANLYLGTTTINGGTLRFAKQVSLYNNTEASWTKTNIIVNSGGTLALNVGGTGEFTTGNVTTLLTNLSTSINNNGLRSGSFIGFDTTNAAGGTFTVADTLANSTGTGSGAVGLTKLGTNTLVLTGPSTYTGATTVSAGTLSAGNIVVSGGNSHLGNAATAVTLGSAGAQGTLSYTGNTNTYTRGFTVGGAGGGRLDVTTSGQTLTVATGAVTGTGLFTVGGAGNTTVSSNLTHTGGLTKTDAGTLTITSTSNSYAGNTIVNQGTLVINGNISTSALTTVASGATLGGSGTVGALTVSSGGFVTPGNSPGILTVNGNYIQAGTYTAEINGLTAGTQHDQIDVAGTVNITGGSLSTSFSGTYSINDMVFILLNNGTDAITGTYAGFAQGAVVATYGGFDWEISYVADSTGPVSFNGGNDIALRAVPEPRAALLGGLGLLMLLRRRRA